METTETILNWKNNMINMIDNNLEDIEALYEHLNLPEFYDFIVNEIQEHLEIKEDWDIWI